MSNAADQPHKRINWGTERQFGIVWGLWIGILVGLGAGRAFFRYPLATLPVYLLAAGFMILALARDPKLRKAKSAPEEELQGARNGNSEIGNK